MQTNKCIAVTGAAGFLGSRIIRGLIEQDAIVIALGRPGAYENLKARLKSLWWNFPTLRDALEERVIAVECDIAQPNLGLSDEALQLLTERATHFVHAAADVRRKTSDLLKRYYPW